MKKLTKTRKMMSDLFTNNIFTCAPVVPVFDPAQISDPNFRVLAALYFLPGGHYIFRQTTSPDKNKKSSISKFVTANDVAAAFTNTEIDTGWMPAGVVRYGHEARGRWFVYSPPAQKIHITLAAVDDGVSEQQITVPVPRTVMLGVGQEYYLWCIKTKHFEHDAVIFNAPFPNLYPDGKICWGNNTAPDADPKSARLAWELFFSTPFNNHLVNGKSHSQRNDVRRLLRQMDGKNAWPADEWVNIRGAKTVTDALHEVVSSTLKKPLEA